MGDFSLFVGLKPERAFFLSEILALLMLMLAAACHALSTRCSPLTIWAHSLSVRGRNLMRTGR